MELCTMSKSMTTLEIVQSKLPHWYKKYEKDNSIMYAVLKALTDQLNMSSGNIDKLDAMIGIDTTPDEDLEYRWGSLLNMPKSPNETYSDYRHKLMMTYSTMINGGTEEAIKFSIAAVLGINRRNENVDKYIRVYDAWEYTGQIQGYEGGYGGFVCEIDFRVCEGVFDYYGKINNTIEKVKASGVKSYMVVIYIQNEDNVKMWMDETIVDALSIIDDEFATIDRSNDSIHDMISQAFSDELSVSSDDRVIVDNNTLNNNDFVLNINAILNGKSDVSLFDIIAIDAVNEIINMSQSDTHTDSIGMSYSDDNDMSVSDDNTDTLNDIFSDTATIGTDTGIWSCIGTNSHSAVLNINMVTNMFMDIDECVDIINYK